MYDCEINAGDFRVVRGGHIQTLSGYRKLVQEMSHALLTPLGTDRFHVNYGSLLEESIGSPLNEEELFAIKIEVRRVLRELQLQHAELIRQIRAGEQVGTITPEELLYEVVSIKVTQEQTMVLVQVEFKTASSGDLSNLAVTVAV